MAKACSFEKMSRKTTSGFTRELKIQVILNYCRNKTVLDLGCIDPEAIQERMAEGIWLHSRIKEGAQRVIGIDILEDYILKLRESGFDIRYGDVEHLEKLELDEKFDVIVAGDVIEHLFNPGLFLDGVKRFFKKDACMIITTPNCFAPLRTLHTFLNRELVNRDHTCWYSYNTLRQLLELKGYKIKEDIFSILDIKKVKSFMRKCLYRISKRFIGTQIFIVSLKE